MGVKEKLVVEGRLLLVPEGNDITGIEDELFRSRVSAFCYYGNAQSNSPQSRRRTTVRSIQSCGNTTQTTTLAN